MENNVVINISARHIHLTKESIDILFGHDLNVKKKLNQVGQFAACEVVSLKNGDKVIENVRVVGPARSCNQVEISASDARFLSINPPVRESGNLKDAATITIATQKGEITGNFAIIAKRHVHFSPSDAKLYGILDKDILFLSIKNEKDGIIKVEAKVSNDGFYEAHLDTDDANAFLIKSGDIGVLKK